MRRVRRSPRGRLALLGFLAIFVPVLVLFSVASVTEERTTERRGGVERTTTDAPDGGLDWALWTLIALGGVAGALAWRGADAMVARLERASETQKRLIEETSHELRTPLAVLVTNADVLLAQPDATTEDLRDALARSKAAATRMRSTIDGLLIDARGRARTIDRRPADLMAIVAEVADHARVLAEGRGVALRLDGPARAVCPVDEPTVSRAVRNLVDNAITHAPAGSTVELAVEVTPSAVTVVVIDHGAGIPTGQQDRVFERFWRGDGDETGTGLGLPIARQIARAHGGDVTVRSPGTAGDGCELRLSVRRR